MWMIIIQYEYENEVLIYEEFSTAEKRYIKEIAHGQVVYLTKIIKTNM